MRLRFALPVATAALGLSTSAAAAPQFGPAITVATHGIPSLSAAPLAAVNAKGDWAVAWFGFTGDYLDLYVRRGVAGGALGPAEVVARKVEPDAALVVAPDGTTAIARVGRLRRGAARSVLVTIAPSGRVFAKTKAVAAVRGSVYHVSLAATPDRLAAAWLEGGSQVRYALSDDRGRFGAAHTLTAAYDSNASVAADDKGNLVIAYQTPRKSDVNAQNAVAVLPRGATKFNPPQVISRDTQESLPGSEAAGLPLAAGPGGVASAYSVEGVLPWQIRIATLQDDLTFSAPQTVGTVDDKKGNHGFYGPVAALPQQGPAVAAWAPYDTGCGECEEPRTGALDAAIEEPDGSFAPKTRLSRNPSRSVQAAATTNLAILAWGEGRFDQERLRYVVHTAEGGFTTPRLLDRHHLRDPALAGDGAHAVIAWISGHTVRVAQLTDGGEPSTATARAASRYRLCGTKELYGHQLQLRVTGRLISCASVRRITHGHCRDGKRWSCFSFQSPGPVLAWFPTREMFRLHWSTTIEARRYPCTEALVTRRAWAAASHGVTLRFPTLRQVLADDLLRCHQLRGMTFRAVRRLLGKPYSNSFEDGDRYISYDLGEERDSFFQIDGESLGVRFGPDDVFRDAGIFQG